MSDELFEDPPEQKAIEFFERALAEPMRKPEGPPFKHEALTRFREELIWLSGKYAKESSSEDRYQMQRSDSKGFRNPEIDFLFWVWAQSWKMCLEKQSFLCQEVKKRCSTIEDGESVRSGFIEWLAEVDPDLPADAFDRITDENKDQFPFRQVGEYQKWLTEMAWEFFKAGAVWRQNHECKE